MARRGGDDGDRPKRTWREIDKARGGGTSRRQTKDDRERERLERSPVYEQYKARVSKMFDGGELPEMLREKLAPDGSLKARDELLAKIKKLVQESRKDWELAVKEFVAQFELPVDAYLLVEWLDHPSDLVIEKALAKLEELAASGVLVGVKRPKSIEQRLRSIEMSGGDPDVLAKAKALRERLR